MILFLNSSIRYVVYFLLKLVKSSSFFFLHRFDKKDFDVQCFWTTKVRIYFQLSLQNNTLLRGNSVTSRTIGKLHKRASLAQLASNTGTIPYLGSVLTDLTFLNTAFPDYIEVTQIFCWWIWKLLSSFSLHVYQCQEKTEFLSLHRIASAFAIVRIKALC